MSVAICVASYGAAAWADRAAAVAMPSARACKPQQLISLHDRQSDACTARNAAARAALADWLCFLDADDELDPEYLQALAPHLHRLNTLLVPYVVYASPAGRTPAQIPNEGNWPMSNDAVTGTLISRKLFERVGGWRQEFWPWPDWELWLRCLHHGADKEHVPGAVYIAHRHNDSANATLSARAGQALHAKVRALYPEQFA